jgi:hypothetical protein
MESSKAFLQRKYRMRLVSWILLGASVPAIIWSSVVLAHLADSGSKGAVLVFPLLTFAFGFLALLLGGGLLYAAQSQINSYRGITSSDHPVLLRWQCTNDEASRFVAAEANRLRVSRRATLYFILVLIAAGIMIAYIQREHFAWGAFFIGYAILGGCLTFFYITWRASNASELRAAKARANSEVVIDAEGLLTGTDVYQWRSFNWGLEEATYESGQPDVLNLVFLAGMLPGSATLGAVRTAAYAAGEARSPGGSTQTHVNVRIPVTTSKADDVRHLLSTTIAQHLLTPPAIP